MERQNNINNRNGKKALEPDVGCCGFSGVLFILAGFFCILLWFGLKSYNVKIAIITLSIGGTFIIVGLIFIGFDILNDKWKRMKKKEQHEESGNNADEA
jgi:hypothetical protein